MAMQYIFHYALNPFLIKYQAIFLVLFGEWNLKSDHLSVIKILLVQEYAVPCIIHHSHTIEILNGLKLLSILFIVL